MGRASTISMKYLIRKLKDEQIRIEFRSQKVIDILKQIAYKNKPTLDDIGSIKKAIDILENKKEK
jgi:hypothetical protein